MQLNRRSVSTSILWQNRKNSVNTIKLLLQQGGLNPQTTVDSKRRIVYAPKSINRKEMLHDSIMTEKYISEAYNNTVMECTNQNIVQALQHIQQEEQNHANSFLKPFIEDGTMLKPRIPTRQQNKWLINKFPVK